MGNLKWPSFGFFYYWDAVSSNEHFYITQVESARCVEVISKELFPSSFTGKFTQKKLNHAQKRKLNRQIYSEAEWKIDHNGKLSLNFD